MTDRLDELGAAIDAKYRRHDDTLGRLATSNNNLVSITADHGERIEMLEGRADLPRGDGARRYTREDDEYKSVFIEWMRKPLDDRRKARLAEAQHVMSQKDVTIGSNIAGGYALPKEISQDVETRVRQLNPFRDLVDVVQVGTNDFHSLVSLGDATSGWSSETGTRTATLSPNLRDVAPTFGEQ